MARRRSLSMACGTMGLSILYRCWLRLKRRFRFGFPDAQGELIVLSALRRSFLEESRRVRRLAGWARALTRRVWRCVDRSPKGEAQRWTPGSLPPVDSGRDEYKVRMTGALELSLAVGIGDPAPLAS